MLIKISIIELSDKNNKEEGRLEKLRKRLK
jgi:hypothetical protein